MRTDIGRYLEGRLLPTINIIKTLYDVGLGTGFDAVVWIEGRQLVFGRNDPNVGRGFMRLTPGETNVIVSFPRGHELMDPKKRAKGPLGSETRMVVSHPSEVDPYMRRMIDQAYALDA